MPGHVLASLQSKPGRKIHSTAHCAECDALNPRPHYSKEVLDNAIDMSRFYKEPCCLYAGLNAMLAPTTSPEIARILLSSLLMAGMAMPRAERKMHVVIIFDEWQTAISATSVLERALQQSRSVGASLVLSNQTCGDFKQKDADLTSTVYGNTASQAWFSVRDPLGLEQLSQLGGKTVENTMSESFGQGPNGETYTRSYHQQIVNRFEGNDIARASSIPNQFVTRICINEGLAHYDGLPFVAKADFHITQEEYHKRLNAPWPEATPDTIIVGQQPQGEPQPKLTPRKRERSPVLSTQTLDTALRPRKGAKE